MENGTKRRTRTGVLSSRTRGRPRLRAPGNEPAILQALDHEKAPVLAIGLAHDVCRVVLVDHLRRGLAVLLHHPVHAVSDLAEVQSAFVRLAPACAPQLRPATDSERELPGSPSVAFHLPMMREANPRK